MLTPSSQNHISGITQGLAERVFEFSPDAILVVGSGGLVREANPQTARIFGYSREELVGQCIEMLVPERYRQVHTHHRAGY
jgi:PAS domain S-box-containing protein